MSYRRIGLSKRHHSCDHCGKRDLASTVVFADGAKKVHLGSECARKRADRATTDRLGARAFDHRGHETWKQMGSSRSALMAAADREAPTASHVVIRDDHTSDGTYFGPGRGRVVASRTRSGGVPGPNTGPGGWVVETYQFNPEIDHARAVTLSKSPSEMQPAVLGQRNLFGAKRGR